MSSGSSTRSRTVRLALFLLLLIPLTPQPHVLAGEEDESQNDMRMAMIDTGALTAGVPSWGRARAPSLRRVDSDEETPLFGYQHEEARYPLGQISDLVELVKSAVSPRVWEELDGADVIEAGSDRLVVRAPRELILRVQQYVEKLEARTVRPITIELQARRAADPEAAAKVASHAGNLTNEAWSEILGQTTLLRAATVTALEGQDATLRSGSQRAWLAAYEGINRDTLLSADPEVRVANLGLSARVVVTRAGNGTARLLMDAVLSEWSGVSELPVEGELTVQTPRFDRVEAQGEYLVRTGSWHVVQAPGGGSGVLLLARVHDRIESQSESARPRFAGALFLPRLASGGPMGMSLAQYDCGGLASYRASRYVPTRCLHASRFTLPEPPELDDPQPLFPTDNLPDLIMMLSGPDDWDDPATIEIRGSQLFVRNTANIQRNVGELVKTLRTHLAPAIALDVQIIEGGFELLDHLGLETVGRGTLGAASLEALAGAIADGSAVHRGRQRLRTRNTLAAGSSGRESHYLADYDVDRHKSGRIQADLIMGEIFSGTQVGARALPTVDGRSVRVDLDVWRSADVPAAASKIQTPHGAVQLPAMAVSRWQGTAKVLLDRTQVVGGAIEGDRVQLVLMHASWE